MSYQLLWLTVAEMPVFSLRMFKCLADWMVHPSQIDIRSVPPLYSDFFLVKMCDKGANFIPLEHSPTTNQRLTKGTRARRCGVVIVAVWR